MGQEQKIDGAGGGRLGPESRKSSFVCTGTLAMQANSLVTTLSGYSNLQDNVKSKLDCKSCLMYNIFITVTGMNTGSW